MRDSLESYTSTGLIVLMSLFISSITIASFLAQKIVVIFGIYVPAGVFAYAVTFAVTDIVSEVWDKKLAQNIVIGGFVALALVVILVQLSIMMPKAPFWNLEDSYNRVLGSTSRIIFASFSAYLVSQFYDVWVFHFLKRLTSGSHLWLRNNLSTITSQLIDSLIFITFAFYGDLPIVPLIFGQWIVKIVIAMVDTPIVYAAVWVIRKKKIFGRSGSIEAV